MRKGIIGTVAVALTLVVIAAVTSTSNAQRGGRGGETSDAPFSSKSIAMDDGEKQIMSVMEYLRANDQYRNVPLQDGQLLRLLTGSMQAKQVVEIGTSTGYSGLWFGMALRKTGGKLITFEIDKDRAATAKANFDKAGLADIITIRQGDAHELVKDLEGPIDLLFLDADKEGYIDYLNKLMPKVRVGGLIVAHNINARMADPEFIKAISDKAELETLYMQGMSITMKKR